MNLKQFDPRTYDVMKDGNSYWFRLPTDKTYPIEINRINDKRGREQINVSIPHEQERIYGLIIPVSLFRELRENDTNYNILDGDVVENLRKLMFQLTSFHDSPLDWNEKQYYMSKSPLFALSRSMAECIERVSIGAGISRANNIPTRIVGNENLSGFPLAPYPHYWFEIQPDKTFLNKWVPVDTLDPEIINSGYQEGVRKRIVCLEKSVQELLVLYQ